VNSHRIFIPTRDSSRWLGQFIDAYRRRGVEPLYILDTRSDDATKNVLVSKGAAFVPFTPSADYAEAGMVQFGANAAGNSWVLRLDDDEFPTKALIEWMEASGAKSLNQAWQISRRELYLADRKSGVEGIAYSRARNRYPNQYRPEFMHPQPRFFNVGRVDYLEQVHTVGYQNPQFFDFAPPEAFFIHCDCLVRSQAQRLAKIMRYEEILPRSSLKLGDEYLPELFDVAHHKPANDGLSEFRDLFLSLPLPEDENLALSGDIKALIYSEVEKQSSFIRSNPSLKFHHSADAGVLFRFGRMLPRPMQRRVAELMTTLGFSQTGADLWNYLTVTSKEFEQC
jgi:hypothetical protein